MDARGTLASNVMVVGGGAMIPGSFVPLHFTCSNIFIGLRTQLYSDIVEVNSRVGVVKNEYVGVPHLPCPPNLASWAGMSLLSALSVLLCLFSRPWS